jgi:Spy/CpxP family protein refolding chaperone
MATKDNKTRKVQALTIVLGIIAVLVAGAIYAQAQQGPGARGAWMGRMAHVGAGGPMGQAGMGRGFMGQGREGMGRMGMGPMGMPGAGLRELKLTAEQREQLRTLVDEHKGEHQALAERAAPAHRELADAIAAEPFNENAIRAASAKVASVQADMAVERAKMRALIFEKILTEEQRAKAKELHDRARTRVEARRGIR